jgi:asparagine N-glycosylation enzyme membrane subunit Stt3
LLAGWRFVWIISFRPISTISSPASTLTDPAQRRYLLEDGWKGISRIFVLACALDVVYQLIEWRRLKPVEMLLTAVILAVVPYALSRGPINRLLRLRPGTQKRGLGA